MTGGLFPEPQGREPEAVADARRFGMDAASIAALEAALTRNGAGGGVWPRNVPAVEAFLAAASQWRTALMPAQSGFRLLYVGLDYAGARIGIEAAGLVVTPALWAGLTIVEQAARDALNGSEG